MARSLSADPLDGEDEHLVIVMLNGTSSSGKTALARALQIQWRGPLLHLGTDTAHGMLPASYVGMKPTAREGIEFYTDADDRTSMSLLYSKLFSG